MSEDTLDQQVRDLQTRCLEEEIPVAQAAREIDRLVGGVQMAEYKQGVKASIYTKTCVYRLASGGYRRRCEERNIALLIGLYDLARAHGSMQPGGVHAGRECSTKHHTGGINDIRAKYLGGLMSLY